MRVVQSSRNKPEWAKQPEPELVVLSAALLLCAATVNGGLGHQFMPLMAKRCCHLLSVCAPDTVLALLCSRNSKDTLAGDCSSRQGPANCTVRPLLIDGSFCSGGGWFPCKVKTPALLLQKLLKGSHTSPLQVPWGTCLVFCHVMWSTDLHGAWRQ